MRWPVGRADGSDSVGAPAPRSSKPRWPCSAREVTRSAGNIADRADVSRRTVYQHFPTLEQLLVDATVGLLSQASIDEALDAATAGRDGGTAVDEDEALERVSSLVRAPADASAETLPLGRSLIRLTVAAPPEPGVTPRRGYRRVQWIERAVEPIRPRLAPARFERLVSGLAMVLGWEGLIVLQDLRALDPDEQHDTTLWAARALVRAALEDA